MEGRGVHGGLRARKEHATRARLVDAALARFAEEGFETTTVDTIAEDAEVSRRTFFRYFPSKEDLLFVDGPRRLAEFEAQLAPSDAEETPLESVKRACLGLASEYMQQREALRTRQAIVEASPVLARRERQLDREFETAIVRAVSRRYRRPPAALRRRIRVFAGAIFGAIRAALDHWFAEDCRPDLVAFARDGFDFFEHGLKLPAPTARASHA